MAASQEDIHPLACLLLVCNPSRSRPFQMLLAESSNQYCLHLGQSMCHGSWELCEWCVPLKNWEHDEENALA